MVPGILGGGDSEYWAILAFMIIWILGSKTLINDHYKYLCKILCFIIFFRNLINLLITTEFLDCLVGHEII